MKRILASLIAAAAAGSLFAQGTITFTTFSSANGVNAKVYWDWAQTTPLAGPYWMAQLLAAPGLNRPESALVMAPGTTTFRTGSAAGYVNLTTITLAGVPADYTGGATVRMVVWYNESGLYGNWYEAEFGAIYIGVSPLLNITQPIGGAIYSPPYLTGLQGFYIVPEPSPLTLITIGAGIVWRFRRRK